LRSIAGDIERGIVRAIEMGRMVAIMKYAHAAGRDRMRRKATALKFRGELPRAPERWGQNTARPQTCHKQVCTH
jgi:hypothetical protein